MPRAMNFLPMPSINNLPRPLFGNLYSGWGSALDGIGFHFLSLATVCLYTNHRTQNASYINMIACDLCVGFTCSHSIFSAGLNPYLRLLPTLPSISLSRLTGRLLHPSPSFPALPPFQLTPSLYTPHGYVSGTSVGSALSLSAWTACVVSTKTKAS